MTTFNFIYMEVGWSFRISNFIWVYFFSSIACNQRIVHIWISVCWWFWKKFIDRNVLRDQLRIRWRDYIWDVAWSQPRINLKPKNNQKLLKTVSSFKNSEDYCPNLARENVDLKMRIACLTYS